MNKNSAHNGNVPVYKHLMERVQVKLYNNPVFLIAVIFLAVQLVYFFCYLMLFYFGKVSPDLFVNMCRRDCLWYLSIIDDGYDLVKRTTHGGQSNWAFFPLFPLVSKALIALFHSKFSVIIFNQILFFYSLFLLYQYCIQHYSKKIALYSVCLLGFSFINVYISSFYTESLFLFLTLLSMHLISKQKYLLASVACGLLSATRMQGAVMLFPLLFNFLMANKFLVTFKNLISVILLTLLSLSGLLVFMFYMHYHVGDSLAFVHIQSTWLRGGHSWLHPIEVMRGFRLGKPIDLVFEFLTLPCLYYFYKNKKWNELIFLLGCFFMVFLSQNFNSYARFSIANYCFYIYLATQMRGWCRSVFIAVPTVSIYIVFLCLWLAFPSHAYY